MKGSWKTTAAGVLLGISLLTGQGAAVLDDDPNTKTSSSVLIAGLGAFFGAFGLGWFSRDKDVSSEDQGIKK